MDPVIYSLKFYPATPLSVSHFRHVRLFVTLWTIAHQPTLSMGFSRQEDWSCCHFLLQGIFPTQESNPDLLHLPALAGGFFASSATWGVRFGLCGPGCKMESGRCPLSAAPLHWM